MLVAVKISRKKSTILRDTNERNKTKKLFKKFSTSNRIFHRASVVCDRYFYHDFSLSGFILDEFSPNCRHVSIANICTQPPFVQHEMIFGNVFFFSSCHMVMTMSIEHKEH